MDSSRVGRASHGPFAYCWSRTRFRSSNRLKRVRLSAQELVQYALREGDILINRVAHGVESHMMRFVSIVGEFILDI